MFAYGQIYLSNLVLIKNDEKYLGNLTFNLNTLKILLLYKFKYRC